MLPKTMRAPSWDEVRQQTARGDLTDLWERERPAWWPGSPPGARHPVYVLGIDCGEQTGVALLSPLHRIEASVVEVDHGRWLPDGVARAEALLDQVTGRLHRGAVTAPLIVAIEDPWVGKSPQAAIAVARYVGAYTYAAVRRGFPVWRIHPSRWQAALGRRRSEDTKTWSKRRASELFGRLRGREWSEHEADAALLAFYASGGGGSQSWVPKAPKSRKRAADSPR